MFLFVRALTAEEEKDDVWMREEMLNVYMYKS